MPTRAAPGGLAAPSDGIGGYVLAGLAVILLLAGGVGGWAATTQIASAVLSSGTVVVDSNVKKVQHPVGGVVGEIHVRDGDSVKAGDLLIRLDETVTRANLAVITRQLDELAMRQARFRAEHDGAEDVALPVELAQRMREPQVAEIVGGERSHFTTRKTAREGQAAQLRERIAQLRDEIAGLAAQERAKGEEARLIRLELAAQHELWQKNLIAISKYTQTQREVARLDGEIAQLASAVAQARGRIAEIEVQIGQIGRDVRTEAMKELRDAQAKTAELAERRIAAEDQLRRIEIRAPIDGIAHQLAIHTVGGVIGAGEAILMLVPERDRLVVEARIAPQDIDRVRQSAPAMVRFPAFNQRTTPEFPATVQRIAADLTRETQQNQVYYLARIELTADAQQSLAGLRLVPGMPADVQIHAGERTALSYLIKPLQDQLARAFREQ